MAALIVGTLFALGALTYVLWPLIVAAERPSSAPHPPPGATTGDIEEDVMPRVPDVDAAASDDAVEAEIRRVRAQTRVCRVCGPRPEPAARYCSRCGRALA
jgi:ribosomal protein L40E